MSTQAVIASIRARDFGVVSRAGQAGPDLAVELRAQARTLDETARQIGALAVAKQNAKGAGAYLLTATGDPDTNVAAAAARSIVGVTDLPPASDILAALPLRPSEFVREKLYYAVGKTKDEGTLDRLRLVAAGEPGTRAGRAAQCAIVKLGGRPERFAFLARVASARPDDCIECCEQLKYIGDPRLAKGMLPWFTDERTVMRLGSDRTGPQMARMCDLAVWTAHELGVKFPPQPTMLDTYDGAMIARALSAVTALPE